MRVERLLRTPPAALVDRARQEMLRRLERRRWERGPRVVEPAVDDPVAGAAALARFCRSVETRFFAGAVSEAVPAQVAARFPAVAARLRETADAVCRGRFDLLGYRELHFGDPIDWHLDPVAGRRVPSIHASRLDPLDTARVGDSKVVWELGRHQWLVTLGQAWTLTGEARYPRVFATALNGWLDANPPGLGLAWASSLEAALRIIAWTWALALFRRADALTPALFARVRASIAVHARHVRRYLSHDFSPNTHLTGEALGLFYAGLLFDDLPAAEDWRRTGLRVLVREVKRQVLPDGVYFEQSTCYARYTADMYLHLLLLAARTGQPVPPVVRERTRALLGWLADLRRPDGTMPAIGDADGGRLLPLALRAPDDFEDTLAIGALVLGEGRVSATPEALWLLPPERAAAAPAGRPPDAGSRARPLGGWVVMRRGGEQLLLDVGPLGCPVSAGHGHADLLAIQCSAAGEAFVVDPGTGSYADPEWRAYFRSTAAHSTVTVDGVGQAIPRGVFGWARRPSARLRRWIATPALDFADAQHDAYRRLPDPVFHRRRVLFDRDAGCWLVVDDLQGRREHGVEIRWQFSPRPVALEGPWGRACGRADLVVGAFAQTALKLEVDAGGLLPPRGWLSPAYGDRVPAPMLRCVTVTRLPLRVLTVLRAVPGGAPPGVEPVLDADGGPVSVRLDGKRDLCVAEDHVRAGDAVARW